MSQITEEIKSKAEIHYGNEICQERSKLLLTEMGLPNNLLPLEDIVEFGWVKETGFFWLQQKKEKKHKFEKVESAVSYATVVTAYIEPNKMKKLTGVKTKVFLIWVTVSDIYLTEPVNAGNITFQSPAGLSTNLPVSAFQVEVPEKKEELVVKGATKEGQKTAAARIEAKDV